MATQAAISVEEYLRSSYDYDPEYVRGEVVERPMPTKKHNKAGKRFLQIFQPLEAALGAFVIYEVRSRLDYDLVRLPDISLYLAEPDGDVPTEPPLVAVEILSPDDRLSRLSQKLVEHLTWGVAHCWVADPESRRLYTFDGHLQEVDQFTLPEFNLTITPAQIFE
jgi:Uma2 family endonuclease